MSFGLQTTSTFTAAEILLTLTYAFALVTTIVWSRLKHHAKSDKLRHQRSPRRGLELSRVRPKRASAGSFTDFPHILRSPDRALPMQSNSVAEMPNNDNCTRDATQSSSAA